MSRIATGLKIWLRTTYGLIRLLNLLAIAALLLAYISYHVSPLKTVIPVFFGLSYPFWLILNVLFLLFWTLRKKAFLLFSLLAILIGWNHIFRTFNVGFGKAQEAPESGIKVMSYNVKLFDVYAQRNNPEKKTHRKIYRFLEQEQPEVICFQEFYTEDNGEMAVLDSLLASRPGMNYHVDFFQTLRKDHHWGIATFSKYPVLNRQRHQFRNSTGNYCILTDISYEEDTLRIINTHLESWHFEQNDYKLLQSMKNRNVAEDTLQKSIKSIYWKIENAYLKRAVQIEELKSLIEQSEYPVIVCGDFNDPPLSYTYHLMSNLLEDAFMEKGQGLGKTFREGLPYFRIDYIFHDAAFETLWFKTYDVPYSDHYPVSAVLNYKEK